MPYQSEVEVVGQLLAEVAKKEGKYKVDAYGFVVFGISELIFSKNKDPKQKKPFKIDQREMLQWLRLYGWYRFGPLAGHVFEFWKVKGSPDFFTIIEHLLDHGIIDNKFLTSKFSKSYAAAEFDFSDYTTPEFYNAFGSV